MKKSKREQITLNMNELRDVLADRFFTRGEVKNSYKIGCSWNDQGITLFREYDKESND